MCGWLVDGLFVVLVVLLLLLILFIFLSMVFHSACEALCFHIISAYSVLGIIILLQCNYTIYIIVEVLIHT